MKKKTFSEFWPFYLSQHSHPVSRWLHVAGTSMGLAIGFAAYWFQSWPLVGAAFGCGYAFAWIGHFIFEKNRPATFQQPFFSFAGDFVLLFKTLTGQIGKDLAKLEEEKLAAQSLPRKTG